MSFVVCEHILNITAVCRLLLILLTVQGAVSYLDLYNIGMSLTQVICSNTAPKIYIPMLNVEISAILCFYFALANFQETSHTML